MSLDELTVGFPLNIVDALAVKVGEIEGVAIPVPKRPLRLSDPAISVGVHADDWVPKPDSFQIGQVEPSLATYMVRVQTMVRHSNEEEGRKLHTAISKHLRALLYRDEPLRVSLGGLYEDIRGSRERVQRFGVARQRFLNNTFNGVMVYLATTDFFVETETVTL
jgi:hypothetical protein